jgi:hypothetical protein
VEIDADDRVINGSNLGFGFIPFDDEPRGLKPRDKVPRLSTIGDADYDTLSECTTKLNPDKAGWYWAPSSANVYRRGVIHLARPAIDAAINFTYGNVYFCVLCHILGGSAVIDRTLSAYRIHRDSDANVLPSMAQMRTAKKPAAATAQHTRHFVLRTLLQRADSLSWIIKDRYWQPVDQQSGEESKVLGAYYADPDIQQIFADHLAELIGAFGTEVVMSELGARLQSAESRFAILRSLFARAPSFERLLKAVAIGPWSTGACPPAPTCGTIFHARRSLR